MAYGIGTGGMMGAPRRSTEIPTVTVPGLPSYDTPVMPDPQLGDYRVNRDGTVSIWKDQPGGGYWSVATERGYSSEEPGMYRGHGNLQGGRRLGVPASGSATPNTASPGATTAASPALPDYSHVDDLINQINSTLQSATTSAQANRIPGGTDLERQSSADIAQLLNPPHEFGEIDVPAAAAAVASGTVGSPFAGMTGIQLSENERLRRIGLGQQYLSAALARNPAAPIADPQSMVQLLQQQQFAASQGQLARDFQAQQNAQQRALQAYLAGLGTAGRGGGYYPHLPSDYTRPLRPVAPRPTPYHTDIPGPSPIPGTPPSGSGYAEPAPVLNPYFGVDPGDIPYTYSGDPSALSGSEYFFPGGPGSVPYQYPGEPEDISGSIPMGTDQWGGALEPAPNFGAAYSGLPNYV